MRSFGLRVRLNICASSLHRAHCTATNIIFNINHLVPAFEELEGRKRQPHLSLQTLTNFFACQPLQVIRHARDEPAKFPHPGLQPICARSQRCILVEKPRGGFVRIASKSRFIDGEHNSALEHHSPAYHDTFDRRTVFCENDLSLQVAKGHIIDVGKIEEYQVCLISGRDATDLSS